MSHQQWQNVVQLNPEGDISICFVHFRSLNLTHLDAAWYSLSKQDMTGVNGIWFLDNNTEHTTDELNEVLFRYPGPPPFSQFWQPGALHVEIDKHGDPKRTQSWSVNHVCQRAPGPWIFFTRSDYILAFDCLARMRDHAREQLEVRHRSPFVSGWCWQMAYDREAQNIDANIDIEQYGWREGGMPALLQHPYAFRFHETDLDAGVWFTKKEYLANAGWMNENLSSWGYQQSTFQRALTREAGVTCSVVQDYLFAHQHHYAVRDFEQAKREWQAHSGL